MDKLTPKKIAEKFSVSVSFVRFCVNAKILIPDAPSTGQGKSVEFSEKNVLEFAIIRLLYNGFKMSLKGIQKIIYMNQSKIKSGVGTIQIYGISNFKSDLLTFDNPGAADCTIEINLESLKKTHKE